MQSFLIKQSNRMLFFRLFQTKKKREEKNRTTWIWWIRYYYSYSRSHSSTLVVNYDLRLYASINKISINRFWWNITRKTKTTITQINIPFILQACSEFRASFRHCCAFVFSVLLLDGREKWNYNKAYRHVHERRRRRSEKNPAPEKEIYSVYEANKSNEWRWSKVNQKKKKTEAK